MRRNLRLDWRALALLGALLSIIIDWPGLVYAMPTILPAVAEAVAAPKTDTLNVIKNDKILNFFPYEHDRDHIANSAKDELTVQTTMKNSLTFSDLQTERTNQDQQQRLSVKMQSTEMEMQQQQQRSTQSLATQENLNSISHSQKNDTGTGVDTAIQQNSHETQSTSDPPVSSLNTHIMDTTTTQATTTTTHTSYTNSSSSIITTTESSGGIQSTLTPTTITDDGNIEDETAIFRSSFQFSSSHHLAILSRTERSIRSSSTVNTKNLSGGGIVRRSSDTGMGGGMKQTKRLNNSRNLHNNNRNNLDRNERSTVSYLSGPSRKIQLYIKNRFLQLMPDGTVNGTQDDLSEYTILQRSTVDVGRIKVQGVATCLYLCMDACGSVYGSKDFTDDCVFNENMEQHNYNTYSSTYNSNARRKYFLALNRHGEPRKLQIPPTRSLGKLSTYTNAITETVPQERVEQLIAKNFGANRIKHGIRQLCDTGKPLIELIDSKNFKARPRCNPNSSNSNSNNNVNNSNSDNSNNSNSNNNSRKNSNSNSGQLLNNVPAANDNSKLSNSNSLNSSSSSSNTSSSSSSISSKPEINSNSNSSRTNSHSSISNSQNNGHISDSSSSSKTTMAKINSNSNSNNNSNSSSSSSRSLGSTLEASSHRNGERGRKKLRKCRPLENEEEHNCQRRPQALRNPGGGGGGPKLRRCRELLLQQQQAGVTDIVLPPMCNKKGGLKRQGGKHKRLLGEPRGKNGLGTDGVGPNNRRGKKLNANGGRQAAKQNQNASNSDAANGVGVGPKKKQKNGKRNGPGGPGGGGGGVNNKKKRLQHLNSTTTTTEKTSSVLAEDNSSSTVRPRFWETTSFMPSTTLVENYDPQAESTSDRGDREQRNVRYSMEESLEVSSEDISSAHDEPGDDDEPEGESDHNVEAIDDNEDTSYEDDSDIGANSSQVPHVDASDGGLHTPLTSGTDDFLYYDQLDL